MVKPAAPEQTPDMEMAPMRVGPDGRPLSGGEMVLDPTAVPQQRPTPGAGEVMEMAPMAVPQSQGGQPAPAAPATGAAAPGAVQPAPATPVAATAVVPGATRAYRAGDLRIVVFSAASDAKAPAYDGIVIELADGGAGHGKTGANAKSQGAGKAAPAAKPAPAKAGAAAVPGAAPATKPAAAPATKPAAPQPAPAAPGH